ncbi:MAG TPA: adenylate/guanylate cyclase domain-containing protein [Candidatus Dormibacteraeota bacterium]
MSEALRPPPTKYARSGDLSIAYHVLGTGPPDIVVTPGSTSHLEFEYGWPALVRFYEAFAAFGRLIRFDKRGTGLSDRVAGIATPEERMDDIRAVMDAARSERAVIIGVSEGGPMSILFAATYPERTRALILYASLGFPGKARSTEEWEKVAQHIHETYGTEEAARKDLAQLAPSLAGDPQWIDFSARWDRIAASPGALLQLMRMNAELDVRSVLPMIDVPTLIVHRKGDLSVDVEHGRYLAANIPGAKLVELEGDAHLPWVGDADSIIDEVEEFVTGVRDPRGRHRVLATVLVTDIVGSTERAVELGDRQWRELLKQHHDLVRTQLARFRGREIDTAGDGFLAAFDGPARAVRCAMQIVDSVQSLGIQVRVGIHTGECELLGDKLAGIAVHIGARVASLAGPGEILVSGTVKDLVAGSGLVFVDRGSHQLSGLPGDWHLFNVDRSPVDANVTHRITP